MTGGWFIIVLPTFINDVRRENMVIILVGHLWTIFRQSQGLMDYHDYPRIHGEFSQFGEIDVCDLPGLVFENWLRYVELSRRG